MLVFAETTDEGSTMMKAATMTTEHSLLPTQMSHTHAHALVTCDYNKGYRPNWLLWRGRPIHLINVRGRQVRRRVCGTLVHRHTERRRRSGGGGGFLPLLLVLLHGAGWLAVVDVSSSHYVVSLFIPSSIFMCHGSKSWSQKK